MLDGLAAWSRQRDPRLLLERRGRWSWPYALLGTLLALGPVLAFIGAMPDDALAWDLMPGDLWTFAAFAGFGASLYVGVAIMALLHKRPPGFAFAYSAPFRWVDFGKAAGAFLAVNLLELGRLALIEPENITLRELPPNYALWLALGLGALLVQTLGEEALFRGYLLRVWGAVLPYRLPIVSALIALFVMLHLENEDVQQDPVIGILAHVISEAVAYFLLLRTGSLAAPWGLHWMNNVWATLLLPTTPGQSADMAIAVYHDPVLAAGGNHTGDPVVWLTWCIQFALFVLLIVWRRSPFHIPPASLTEAAPSHASAEGSRKE